MLQALNNAGTNDPLSLLPIVLEAAKLYGEEQKRCDEDYQRARGHAEAAANFLWLISAGKITPLKFAVRPDDEELQQYFASRIKECPKVPMAPTDHAPADNSNYQNDILKQLSSNLSHQIESLQESNRLSKLEYDRKIEKEEKQKDCLKNCTHQCCINT